ncbi:MAG: tetratricopeptide repeat protein [Deltaproteobacteria bacterium]|nr:tetratricopeptide repeat protein [Deltaproteobacteria bacterium]
MDQFSAHLDRGWDLVQRGDTRGAEASARRALELDPHSPEVFNLLGYVAALEGDSLEAIENYKQAFALDDTYMEAMLNAAELFIHPLGEFDEAIALCEQGLGLAETDEETIDTLLLMFDAMLGKGDVDGGRSVILRLPDGPYDNVHHTFLVGRAWYEIGEIGRAAPLIEEAAKRDPMDAESWYYLGLIRDEGGDAHGATECFLRSRELDVAEPAVAWAPAREVFVTLVKKAISTLDPALRKFVAEAEVYVSEVPGIELVADGVDPRALLLLDGLASIENPGPPCSRVFVYQRNVERVAGCPDKLEQEMQDALMREITATFLENGSMAAPDTRHVN